MKKQILLLWLLVLFTSSLAYAGNSEVQANVLINSTANLKLQPTNENSINKKFGYGILWYTSPMVNPDGTGTFVAEMYQQCCVFVCFCGKPTVSGYSVWNILSATDNTTIGQVAIHFNLNYKNSPNPSNINCQVISGNLSCTVTGATRGVWISEAHEGKYMIQITKKQNSQ